MSGPGMPMRSAIPAAAAAALLLAATVGGQAADVPPPVPRASERVDAIVSRGSLRVAVLAEAPWLTRGADGGSRPFGGPAWLLAEAYAERLGVRIEAVPVAFDDKVAVLAGDRADITVAPLLVTPAREAQADFVPYSTSAQCLFGLADDPKFAGAATIDDLDRPDVTVAVVTGTPGEAWLSRRLPAAARDGIPGTNADMPVGEVLSRRADAAPIDKYFFADLSRRVPGLATLPRGEACLRSHEMEVPVGLAVAKGQPAFLAWLRDVAAALKPRLAAEEARVVGGGN